MYSPSFVLSLLAVGVVLSLILAFLANRASLLTAPIRKQLVTSALLCGLLLALVIIYLTVRLHAPTTISTPTQTLVVEVTFSAPSHTKQLMNVPFSVSSESVNVGCDEPRQVSLPFHIPADVGNATINNVQAQWVNTDNVASQSATATLDGPKAATAIGFIRGIPRNFLFNCAGGGHGTLTMRGTYSYEKETKGPDAVVGTIRDSVPVGARFTAALPPDSAGAELKFDISVTSGGQSSHLSGTIVRENTGTPSLSVTEQTGAISVKPSVERGFLIVQF
jgi:hypothetical protein